MWDIAIRGFVVTSMVLNGAAAVALATALASGYRAASLLDLFVAVALLLGFLNAVGDLIEAEGPVVQVRKPEPDRRDAVAAPSLHVIRTRAAAGGGRPAVADGPEGLDSFSSEG
jgi:hypothetical protein